MQIVKHVSQMREIANGVERRSESVGLVPTMGALHDGHLSLVKRAREMTDCVVLSVFVNPLQFGPSEDLNAYPRDIHRDIELAQKEGVGYVFLPEVREMYPAGHSTYVRVEGLEDRLCGRNRPGHFRGVATVVTKLISIVCPDFAFFGEKDYQQLVIIKRLVRDLNLDVEIVGCPTLREADGLAMSSRNAYLDPEERVAARVLSRALNQVREVFEAGERRTERLRAILEQEVASEPLVRLDYGEIVDVETLEDVTEIESEALCAVAAWVGKGRLIDNTRLQLRRDGSEHD